LRRFGYTYRKGMGDEYQRFTSHPARSAPLRGRDAIDPPREIECPYLFAVWMLLR